MLMLPPASELQYFLEVANTLNVSRAAERLGISQPTLSLAIQRLEGNLGIPVLIRNKSGVKLTHAGQKLVSQARLLLLEWEKIRSDASKEEDEISGSYRLGCHPSVALYSLGNLLPKLLSENPKLQINLVHDLSRKITEDLISFKIDFGIVVNPWNHPDLIIKTIWEDTVEIWTRKMPSDLQDPKNEKGVLICDPDLIQSQAILRQLPEHDLSFKRMINTSNLEVVASLIAAGAGVGILPGRVAEKFKALIKPYSKTSPKFQDRICLIYRADVQKSKASRDLAHKIEEALGALKVPADK